jgi:glycerophosphoryl diester phosphodiesterase
MTEQFKEENTVIEDTLRSFSSSKSTSQRIKNGSTDSKEKSYFSPTNQRINLTQISGRLGPTTLKTNSFSTSTQLSKTTSIHRPIRDNPPFPWDTVSSFLRAEERGHYTGPFDLVYLWANNTKEWSRQRNLVQKELGQTVTGWSPTRDNDELKLSLRSVEKNLPWIRNIYILSNGQKPSWMDLKHPRLKFVDTDKLLRQLNGTTPNFNSHSIYLASGFIDHISEIYLQMDDDFIIGQPLPPDFFFWEYKNEASPLIDWADRDDLKTQKQLLKRILPNYKMRWASHTPRCWNKTRVQELWATYPSEVSRTIRNQLRSKSDIDLTSFYSPYVKAHYGKPIYTFSPTKSTVYKDENETVFQVGSRKALLFYGSAKNFHFNSINCPALICFQDVGVNYTMPLSELSNRLALSPSSFETPDESIPTHLDVNVIGHRGIGFPLLNEAPVMENTLESISSAAEAGVRWVEIDVGITIDGVVIVGHFHDYIYEDCGIKKMSVATSSYTDLSTHVHGNGHLPKPERLFDVLAKFKGKLGFQVELKQGTDYKLAQLCNKAVTNRESQTECSSRVYGHDKLVVGLVNVLESVQYPEDKIIISSFEAPRLNNFRRLSSRSYMLKLVGAQSSGVDGMIRISQKYLGNKPAVSIPLQFATTQRVQELKKAGLNVEIGLPSAGHCLAKNAVKQVIDKEAASKEIARSIEMRPDSICTDFPRDALSQLLSNRTLQ